MVKAPISSSTLSRHYKRIISTWPPDLVRPITYKEKIESHRLKLTGPEVSPQLRVADLRNVNALYSLLDNRYAKQYPLSEYYLEPQSNPNHYKEIIEEFDNAPKRSSFERWIGQWKRMIRFQ
ncbi:hypothetical protein K402DRAFT_452993 [Aulographum hederae CBS 113979]|uniref:Uncharacterized protein n=1 Tax=Aulographum hederae CBS 113979 TaxID=1176131 RepID=A0A6G1H566_9PEZI|nr:hypothetical protein K402DRAFT_452993 [Aulographum hederae CBS 113979]